MVYYQCTMVHYESEKIVYSLIYIYIALEYIGEFEEQLKRRQRSNKNNFHEFIETLKR